LTSLKNDERWAQKPHNVKTLAEHAMLTLIVLIQVKKKNEKQMLACKGDTLPHLPAILVWFHHNLAGLSNSNNDFCFFLSVTPIMINRKKLTSFIPSCIGDVIYDRYETAKIKYGIRGLFFLEL
jgi:hypothetical protein